MTVRSGKLALWTLVVGAVLATWAQYLGLFEDLAWVSPLPRALAWVLGANVVLTGAAVALYFVHFRPLDDRLRDDPLDPPADDPARPADDEVTA
ncbi:hypothetical protein FTX61_15280 [Nitriliruptoraceae bacterium ZYF776]|nr:hypothetical protein [Profundirhabdus halotolerans]